MITKMVVIAVGLPILTCVISMPENHLSINDKLTIQSNLVETVR